MRRASEAQVRSDPHTASSHFHVLLSLPKGTPQYTANSSAVHSNAELG
jgi:hypothetical protein